MEKTNTQTKKYKVINFYVVDGEKIQTTRFTDDRELSLAWLGDGYKSIWKRRNIKRIRNKKGVVLK